jgi:hypothetical protein
MRMNSNLPRELVAGTLMSHLLSYLLVYLIIIPYETFLQYELIIRPYLR